MKYDLSSVNIYVYICVGMPLTTVNNNIHGDHILKGIGRTLNSATHSDQMLENNDKTKDLLHNSNTAIRHSPAILQLKHILTFYFMEDVE